ncbi:hypothetical protein J4032_33515 [Streptomyces formicae]|uniref:Glyoxalase-like domain-containing protein n=1 Tax=Streptomyces formicae TaxID=1616117 RepID=A0ABY3WYV7_9ACTN|nr:hypothetical protein J4032_33515 [Streptomyces formicae]
MVSILQNVAVDCADAYELARFWSRVTGRPLHPEDKPGDLETQVLLAEGPVLHFNQVPESRPATVTDARTAPRPHPLAGAAVDQIGRSQPGPSSVPSHTR